MTACTRSRLAVAIGAMALAATLAGCNLSRPAPVKNTFLLDPPLPPAAATSKPATLRIGTLNVAEPYRDRAFVYRTADLAYEADFHHEFFVAPGAMIAQATARALTASNVFARVVPSGSAPVDGDYVLEAFVSDLYADARQKPAAGVVGITFYLSRTTFPGGVAWSRAYAERTTLAESTPQALAQAWNEALGRVLARLARDLAEAELRAQ